MRKSAHLVFSLKTPRSAERGLLVKIFTDVCRVLLAPDSWLLIHFPRLWRE
jgi:hypothetical protein